MIKIIEGPSGIRLEYDGIEIFNQTEFAPFVKYLKGEVFVGAKGKKIIAVYDAYGEYALTDCRVLSAGAKSANISFSGYGGAKLIINCVEEKNKLVLHLNPSPEIKGLKLTFLSGVLEKAFYCGEDIKGKKGNNLIEKELRGFPSFRGNLARLFDRNDRRLARLATYRNPVELQLSRGVDVSFASTGFTSYDLTKKTAAAFVFDSCPDVVTFVLDNTIKRDILHETQNKI